MHFMRSPIALSLVFGIIANGAATAQPPNAVCRPFMSGTFSFVLAPNNGIIEQVVADVRNDQHFQITTVNAAWNDRTTVTVITEGSDGRKEVPISKNSSYLVTARKVTIKGVRGEPPPYSTPVSGQVNVCLIP